MNHEYGNFEILFDKLKEAKEAANWEIRYPASNEVVEIDVFRQLVQEVTEAPIYESLTRG